MKIIYHRINTINQLKLVTKNCGIEVDLRYHEDSLVMDHDPFSHHLNKPENFAEFLTQYNCQEPLILNIKTEGIEEKCIDLMNKFKIKNWFFLDLSMPYFIKYCKLAERKVIKGFGVDNLAVRFSEEEPLEYALNFSKKAAWVWVDCFTKLPLNDDNYQKLKQAEFKICLVSPELQKHDKARIYEFKNQLQGKKIDAVCTKYPELWA
jgi:hypothetical protein